MCERIKRRQKKKRSTHTNSQHSVFTLRLPAWVSHVRVALARSIDARIEASHAEQAGCHTEGKRERWPWRGVKSEQAATPRANARDGHGAV